MLEAAEFCLTTTKATSCDEDSGPAMIKSTSTSMIINLNPLWHRRGDRHNKSVCVQEQQFRAFLEFCTHLVAHLRQRGSEGIGWEVTGIF